MSYLLIELTSFCVCVYDVTFFLFDDCYFIYTVLDDHDLFVLMEFFSMPSCWPSSLRFPKDFDRTNCSLISEESTSTDELDEDQNNDGEGVWNSDIEQSFHV